MGEGKERRELKGKMKKRGGSAAEIGRKGNQNGTAGCSERET